MRVHVNLLSCLESLPRLEGCIALFRVEFEVRLIRGLQLEYLGAVCDLSATLKKDAMRGRDVSGIASQVGSVVFLYRTQVM